MLFPVLRLPASLDIKASYYVEEVGPAVVQEKDQSPSFDEEIANA
jgi:hypothetical protein